MQISNYSCGQHMGNNQTYDVQVVVDSSAVRVEKVSSKQVGIAIELN